MESPYKIKATLTEMIDWLADGKAAVHVMRIGEHLKISILVCVIPSVLTAVIQPATVNLPQL